MDIWDESHLSRGKNLYRDIKMNVNLTHLTNRKDGIVAGQNKTGIEKQ